ncbi:ABC transporter permease subunit [Rhodoligotrophos defluvii]|uniref:branched-chain amino acid ABC transporter ATP-binding protein/permease n=1 Tax=Rhodoligotrophos defluvii TaxID=2561934 RepID=UPI0010C9FB0A|nr:branched-chain amino acid ABC transporter ATP-binding protein/permease [Rhodoligotrophos defluvii]
MTAKLMRKAPLVLLTIAAVAPLFLTAYQLTIATYVMMFAIVCVGLVLMTGIAGMVSLGQAAFVGVGAYATGYVTTAYGLSPWLGLVVALAAAAVVALVIGSVTVRMSGHYLALATLCFCISFYFLVGNTEALGLFNGLTGIPPVSLAGFELRSERVGYLMALAALAAAVWWVQRLLASRIGRVIRSLRTGSAIAESFGADATHYRLVAFLVAALLAALSGWLYAHVQRFVNPTPFGVHMSIEYLFMTVIGGSGQVMGAILGAGLVTLLKQELQEVLQPLFGATTRLEMLAFAGIMLLVLWRARRGMLPLVQSWLPRAAAEGDVMAPARLPSPRPRPPRGTPLLAAEGLKRNFGGLVAVDEVSLEVRAGEILGLLGPNGAGKSTLFNLISGTLPVSSGRITFLGQEIPRADARTMCRLGMARTFQHVKLVPDMSLIENVAIGATHLGQAGLASASFGLDRAEEKRLLGWSIYLLGRVGLADKAWEPAGALPLGHQRVLEIARALAADPVLLLLDEPAAGLRANEKAELAALLRSLREDGLGILLVEHDMDFVTKLADRLMVMNFGRRIAFGEPAVVRADSGVQEAYLGVPA